MNITNNEIIQNSKSEQKISHSCVPLRCLQPDIVPIICHRCQQQFAAGVVDTGGKFAAGVIDTGGNFATGVIDTGGKFATGVVDTGVVDTGGAP